MTILLTGGAGFIGSHLTARLLTLGHRIICLDNLDNFYSPALKRANMAPYLDDPNYVFVEGDIRDGRLLDAVFSVWQPAVVIHLAAQTGVRPSVQDPALYIDVNVQGTLQVLEAMRRAGVKKMIFGSSSSVYGDSAQPPFCESEPGDLPLSPYAASKRAAELLAHTYHHLYTMDIACLRFFTVYGPRQRPEMAISRFTANILSGEPIALFGRGTTTRDYTYVDDVVTGIVKTLSQLSGYLTLNIGGGQPISLACLVSLIEQATNRKAIIHRLPMQAGDVECTHADLTLARTRIGYEPQVSIGDGIRKFVAWFSLVPDQPLVLDQP